MTATVAVTAEVWPDPERKTHAELARLVADVQDVFADETKDPAEMVEWLLTEAGLWKRETRLISAGEINPQKGWR